MSMVGSSNAIYCGYGATFLPQQVLSESNGTTSSSIPDGGGLKPLSLRPGELGQVEFVGGESGVDEQNVDC